MFACVPLLALLPQVMCCIGREQVRVTALLIPGAVASHLPDGTLHQIPSNNMCEQLKLAQTVKREIDAVNEGFGTLALLPTYDALARDCGVHWEEEASAIHWRAGAAARDVLQLCTLHALVTLMGTNLRILESRVHVIVRRAYRTAVAPNATMLATRSVNAQLVASSHIDVMTPPRGVTDVVAALAMVAWLLANNNVPAAWAWLQAAEAAGHAGDAATAVTRTLVLHAAARQRDTWFTCSMIVSPAVLHHVHPLWQDALSACAIASVVAKDAGLVQAYAHSLLEDEHLASTKAAVMHSFLAWARVQVQDETAAFQHSVAAARLQPASCATRKNAAVLAYAAGDIAEAERWLQPTNDTLAMIWKCDDPIDWTLVQSRTRIHMPMDVAGVIREREWLVHAFTKFGLRDVGLLHAAVLVPLLPTHLITSMQPIHDHTLQLLRLAQTEYHGCVQLREHASKLEAPHTFPYHGLDTDATIFAAFANLLQCNFPRNGMHAQDASWPSDRELVSTQSRRTAELRRAILRGGARARDKLAAVLHRFCNLAAGCTVNETWRYAPPPTQQLREYASEGVGRDTDDAPLFASPLRIGFLTKYFTCMHPHSLLAAGIMRLLPRDIFEPVVFHV
ncbi:hypothetical protein EON66_05875, partial [archaeon]